MAARVRRTRSSVRGRHLLLVVLLALTLGGITAVAARADSGDVKVSTPAPGQHPFQTGIATVDGSTGKVTVDVTGGWSWPTHGHDCNLDRAGTGVAVNWFDPNDRGFHVAYFNTDGHTGALVTTPGGEDDFGVGSTTEKSDGTAGSDNVVHPTENDIGAVGTVTKKARTTTTVTLTVANAFVVGDSITVALSPADSRYDGTFPISARTATTVSYFKSGTAQNATNTTGTVTDNNPARAGAVVDITSPSNWASWRGGCGVFTNDTILVKNKTTGALSYTPGAVAHGNFGKATPSSVDVNNTAFTNPTPPAADNRQGALLRHVYASTDDLTKLCALTYDVHPGTAAGANNGVGITKAASEVTAGDTAVSASPPGGKYTTIHNTDNSIQSNGGTPAGNTCPSFTFFTPDISTVANGGEFDASGSVTLSDEITVSDADPNATGTIEAKMYDSTCTTVVDSTTITLGEGDTPPAVNDTYNWSSTAATSAGDYKFSADLVIGGQTVASVACGADSGETATASKLPTSLTTNSGGIDPASNGTFKADSGGTVDLTDIATLSGGTSDATGTITFELFTDDGSGGCDVSQGTATADVGGADGQDYTSSPAITVGPGLYHWTASYDGDGKNAGTATSCGDTNENPLVIAPGIQVTKTSPDGLHFQSGLSPYTAMWIISITNTGDTQLDNVAVTETTVPDGFPTDCIKSSADLADVTKTPLLLSDGVTTGGNGTSSLDVNETIRYECQTTPVTDPFDNTVVACGDAVGDGNVCDDSTDTLDVRTVHNNLEDQSSLQTILPNDLETVTVSGTDPAFVLPPNGDVSFALYMDDNTCSTGLVKDFGSAGQVDATGQASTSNTTFTVSDTGTYYWLITYSGDTNGNAGFTKCEESFSIDNG